MRSTLKKTLVHNNNDSQIKNYQPKHVKRLEVVDDYIRNFLTKHGMNKTLNSFQVHIDSHRKNGIKLSNLNKTSLMPKLKMKSLKIKFSSLGVN